MQIMTFLIKINKNYLIFGLKNYFNFDFVQFKVRDNLINPYL